jgi:hypothetical protein
LTPPKQTSFSASWMRWAADLKTTARLSLPLRLTPPPPRPWHPLPPALHQPGPLPSRQLLPLQRRLPVPSRISKPQPLPSLHPPYLSAPRLFFRQANVLLSSD